MLHRCAVDRSGPPDSPVSAAIGKSGVVLRELQPRLRMWAALTIFLVGQFLSIFAVPVPAARAQDPFISEILTANATGLKDGDSEPNDWIEIFNPSKDSISIGGWSLTDDVDRVFKWQFPAVSIPGQGFLVVFASGKDRTDSAEDLHTNFSLDRDGEFLALVRPDGTIASQFSESFPNQLADVSYGIQVEASRRTLVAPDAEATLLAPMDGVVDASWMGGDFDDDAWLPAINGIGYDVAPPPEVELEFADASRPGDSITATSERSPVGEEVFRAIDDQPSTKYLNFDTLNAGLTVTLSRGATVVTGLRFRSANDSADRDPTSFVLSGSNDGSNFTLVASDSIPRFPSRFFAVEVAFKNETPFAHYRLIFPTVRDPDAAVAVQISEVEFLALIEVNGGSLQSDVTEAGDRIVPTSFNSPVNEEVDKAIDDVTATKYLNFDTLNAGFTVTPSGGSSVVTGLRFTSANDSPNRDPTSYTLEGSTDGFDFTAIASGGIPDFPGRFASVEVGFANTASYAHYRLLFPTVRDAGSAVAMQVAEVQFLGTIGSQPTALSDLVATEVADQLHQKASGVYVRVPFEVTGDVSLDAPALNVWFSDGFVAFLNGVEIARANAPAGAQWNTFADSTRPRDEATIPERFDLSEFSDVFARGSNVLALHGLNDRRDSPEFLLRAEIVDSRVTVGGDGYFVSPTPGAFSDGPAAAGIVAQPEASVERGFYEAPFMVSLAAGNAEAMIRYTTDGSVPASDNGSEYSGPISVGQSTVLRAVAMRDGWLPSSITTHTYLFTEDILDQTRQSAFAAGFPRSWNSQSADYGLDSRVDLQPEELKALPSISLAIEVDEMFGSGGIYANPTARGAAWERPVSFEWIDPAGVESFGENAGIRIQGGAFRRFDLTLKKSFRVIFRERYGPPRLRRSLFGHAAEAEADSIVLRANGNDAWKWGGAATLYIRDAFAMESMRAMGNVASHSAFAHLYINGQYWGLYNPTERPDAAFSSIYHGGATSSWDALNQDSVPDGNADAWDRLLALLRASPVTDSVYRRIQGNDPDGSRNPDYEVLLDVDNYIDYLILNFYLGNADWPGRNHWYGRDRDGEQGFQFYPWDSETAIGLNSPLNTNRLGVSGAVARPYSALRTNAEFRLRFGDRVHRHFFVGGAFYVDPEAPRWNPERPESNQPARRFSALADDVESAIAAESARWGDQLNSTLFTRERHWQPERDDLLANYFPRRSAIVLEQFRAAGLYPQTDAPVFSQRGGVVPAGTTLTMSAESGVILYTLDRSDPRGPMAVEEVSRTPLVAGADRKHVLVPTGVLDPNWRNDQAWDDASWRSGSGGVGYDTSGDYDDLIGIDVETEMRSVNGSVYIRIPFDHDAAELGDLSFMTLRVRFEDGFVAYLNGREIASSNAPARPVWNSVATEGRTDSLARQWQDFDVSDSLDALMPGQNLIAVHGLNLSRGSSDFLFDAELIAGERTVSGGNAAAQTYTEPLTVSDLTSVKARVLNGDEWSALVETTFIVGAPRVVVSELDYHPRAPSVAEITAGFTDADDFEFIELFNPDSYSLDLTGVRISDGVEFDFTGSGVECLSAGERVVVVNNAAAFTLRYGFDPQVRVAGEYRGRFSNAGERVELVDAAGQTLVAFTYGDDAPWPAAADGAGSSLVFLDADADPELSESWSASGAQGVTPGRAPTTNRVCDCVVTRDGAHFVLTFTAVAGVSYKIQASTKLSDDWEVIRNLDPTPEDTLLELKIEIAEEEPHRFFRVVEE